MRKACVESFDRMENHGEGDTGKVLNFADLVTSLLIDDPGHIVGGHIIGEGGHISCDRVQNTNQFNEESGSITRGRVEIQIEI